jgi:hypothetical protein
MAGDVSLIHWSHGWQSLDDEKHRRYIEGELSWELAENPQHILSSRSCEVIGGLGRYDDFIVRLDGRDEYAWVHLAWRRENQPEWPHCELIVGMEQLNRFLDDWASTADQADT